MHFFRKWLGLTLFVACWLLVLLIPSWRQDAREQWGNETWSFESSTRGLTREKIAVLASRFPDDLTAQLEGLNAQYQTNAPHRSATQARARKEQLFEGYAELSRRFPRENEIRKAWLRDVTRGPLEIEPASTYAAFRPHDRPEKEKTWLSNARLEAAINAAREGARIEPQNSFFPWMECALHFALKRPTDAIKALHRASNCTHFDDGTMQTTRRRLELLGRVQNIGWSEKWHVMSGLLLPHFAQIRASARAAMEISRQAHQRGDKVRALQIAATVARAGATISDSKSYVLAVLVGDAIQQIAWRGALKSAGRDVESPRFLGGQALMQNKDRLPVYQAHREEVAREVAIYARELNHEAIATQALATLPRLKGNYWGAALTDPAFDSAWPRFLRLAKAFWLEARLGRLSLVGALSWVLAFGLGLGRPIAPEIKRSLAIWAAFCVGATAVLLGVAVGYFGLGSPEGSFFEADESVSSYGRDYENNLNGFLALLWLFPLVLTALLNGVRRPQLTLKRRGFSALRVVQTLIYTAMLGSIAAIVSIGNTPVESVATVNPNWVASIFVFIGSILAAGGFHIATTSGKTRIASMLLWTVPWIIYGVLRARASFYDTVWVVLIAAIGLIFLGLSAYLTNWRPPLKPLQFFYDVLSRARVLAATLAVASAIFYVGVKIAVLPQEARMNAILDAQLKMGEVAWLEDQLER